MRAIAQEIRSAWLPLLLGKAFALSCGLIAIPWSTRLIEPDTYAFYALFLTLINFGAAVPFAGWIRFVSQKWPSSSNRPALAHLVLSALSRKALWFFCIPLISGVALICIHPHSLVAVTLGSLAIANGAILLGSLGTAALQAQKAYWTEFAITLGSAGTRSFLPLILAAFLGATPAVLATGVALYTMTWVALILPTWRREWRFTKVSSVPLDPPPTSELTLYAFNGLLLWALLAINRWSTGIVFSNELAGYFNLAATLSFVAPSMLGSTADAVFSPLVYKAANEATSSADWKTIARSTDARACLYLGLALLAAIAVHFIAPLLIGNLIATRYAPATPWLLSCGFFWAALGTHQYYALLLQAAGLHRQVLRLNSFAIALVTVASLATGLIGATVFQLWLFCTPLLLILSRAYARNALLAHR